MNTPSPDRMPEDFDELDTARPLFPLDRRLRLVVACLAGAAILTGALVALVDAWI